MAQLSATEVQYEREHIRQDQVPRIVASYATCLSLAYIAVVLRFIARRISRAPLQADDLTISIALVRSSFTVQSFRIVYRILTLIGNQLFTTAQIIVGSYCEVHVQFYSFYTNPDKNIDTQCYISDLGSMSFYLLIRLPMARCVKAPCWVFLSSTYWSKCWVQPRSAALLKLN